MRGCLRHKGVREGGVYPEGPMAHRKSIRPVGNGLEEKELNWALVHDLKRAGSFQPSVPALLGQGPVGSHETKHTSDEALP
jgi:hypothetical protein